jgi:hypothetical protein
MTPFDATPAAALLSERRLRLNVDERLRLPVFFAIALSPQLCVASDRPDAAQRAGRIP